MTAPRPPSDSRPHSGALDGEAHVFPVRVYFENTDAGGIVYHAEYLRFFERARTEFMRLSGFDHVNLMRDHGMGFAVARVEMDYRVPARLDDALEIVTRVVDVRAASLTMEQRATRRDPETGGRTDLVRMTIRLACVGSGLRAVRMADPMRSALEALAVFDATQ